MWFTWRFKRQFVYEDQLSHAVAGQCLGMYLGAMRHDVEQAIAAYNGIQYEMTIALSEEAVLDLIKAQL